ncbi:hypothetical protein [Burkholderia pyrrocinia]|uniref:hypothetical protein n=1 Tax=Burkholderia pyrrocinia TaxID=60550 RepID=UPI00158D5BCE|nr:hypothetical protein [Burkholderia pyrrocinia]
MITQIVAAHFVSVMLPTTTTRRFLLIRFFARAAVLFFLPSLVEVPPVAGLFDPLSFPGILLQAAVMNVGNLHRCSVSWSAGLSVPRCALPAGSGKEARTGCEYLIPSKFVPLAAVDASPKSGASRTRDFRAVKVRR